MTTWVIEQNIFKEQAFKDIISYFQTNNIPYHTIQVKPFEHTIVGKVPNILGPAVVYGSVGLSDVCKRHKWIPGVFESPQINCVSFQQYLGEDYLNYDGTVGSFQQLKTNLTEYFIRPIADSKDFAGTVMTDSEFRKWQTNMWDSGYLDKDNDVPVFVASPKYIKREWRTVVVNGIPIAGSLYRENGRTKLQEGFPEEVWHTVARAVSKLNPCPVFVADVAYTGDGYKIIEYNTFNHAGFYASNVKEVIKRVNEYVKAKTWKK